MIHTTTAYISIGNSDDKLTQAEWAHFYEQVQQLIAGYCTRTHGRWLSPCEVPWQNACWCVEVPRIAVAPLKVSLANTARAFDQDSIAWAEAPTTEFLGPEMSL